MIVKNVALVVIGSFIVFFGGAVTQADSEGAITAGLVLFAMGLGCFASAIFPDIGDGDE